MAAHVILVYFTIVASSSRPAAHVRVVGLAVVGLTVVGLAVVGVAVGESDATCSHIIWCAVTVTLLAMPARIVKVACARRRRVSWQHKTAHG